MKYCKECQRSFDQPIKDEDGEDVCPHCGGYDYNSYYEDKENR